MEQRFHRATRSISFIGEVFYKMNSDAVSEEYISNDALGELHSFMLLCLAKMSII